MTEKISLTTKMPFLFGSDKLTMDSRANLVDEIDKSTLGKRSNSNPMRDKGILDFKKSVLSFQDINYVAEGKRNWFCGKRKPPFQILDHVSGIFAPGLNAIMGPSGGGKTSLLTILGGRKKIVGAEGIILMNGKGLTRSFTTDSGFVTQEDLLMSTLTVQENIMFSASLRLPTLIPVHRKRQIVQVIIDELNLTKCSNSLVGGQQRRGISGGEKKRCSIGVELVTNPNILFLDEPTTGLDASTAHTVILLLKKLVGKGCNVIMSIHQPRYDIFKLFDTLVLLSNGQVVYHGLASYTLDYFADIGLNCEQHNNPADYFLDIIQSNSKFIRNPKVPTLQHQEEKVEKIDLPQKYRESSMHCALVKELHELNLNRVETPRGGNYISRKLKSLNQATFATSFWHQLLVVSNRVLLNFYRNPEHIYSQLIFTVSYFLMVGIVYFRVDNSSSYAIQNRSGAIFIIVMDQVGNLAAIDMFVRERALYLHETTNGFYRVSVYFISNLLGDLIPMRYLPIAIVSIIAYWMVGLQANAAHYFMFILALMLLSTSASSIMMLCGVAFERVDVAGNICLLYFILLLAAGGYIANVNSIPPFLSWIKYFSIFRYGSNVLLINEIKGEKYCDAINNTTLVTALAQNCSYGNDYLEMQGIAYQSLWDLWSNMIILFGMTLIFWFLTYFQLVRLKKNAKG